MKGRALLLRRADLYLIWIMPVQSKSVSAKVCLMQCNQCENRVADPPTCPPQFRQTDKALGLTVGGVPDRVLTMLLETKAMPRKRARITRAY